MVQSFEFIRMYVSTLLAKYLDIHLLTSSTWDNFDYSQMLFWLPVGCLWIQVDDADNYDQRYAFHVGKTDGDVICYLKQQCIDRRK